MNKVAFICPIYDSRNHFQFGKELYKSKIDNNITADLYFIFSDEYQKDKFFSLIKDIGKESDFQYLMLPKKDQHFKSQVTIKKFFGLKCLKEKYDYLATIDSETRFVKNVDYELLFDTMWKNQDLLKANRSPNGFFIMRQCFKTLGIYKNKILREETGNYLYNIWFNDIPLYKSEVLDDFFHWLDELDDGYKNDWYCFEYYIFMAFLVIEKNYHIKKYDYESLGGIMEYLYLFPQEKQYQIIRKLNSHWTSSDDCVVEQSSIRFHLDRDENDLSYNSKDFDKQLRKNKIKRLLCLIKDYTRGEL